MSFNIFGPAEKDSIKVGYISTDRGFVEDISVCEANDYAKLNPGTQFIFKNRKYIKFLNINEVNKLTTNDLLAGISTCEGVQLTAECPPAEVYFYGGGGVGVQGNPVFGSDGALLAVDLVSGGFGYEYPPIVEVKDGCGIGVGAVTRAILGEIVETVEVYDQEEDFEEYEICEPTDPGYGNRYGPNGELLGEWDPATYTNLTQNPIRREILLYQDFLQKKINPWWTTRKSYAPPNLISPTKTTRTKFDVTDASHLELVRKRDKNPNYTAWNEFMNTYAISPVPPSNVKNSDFAGIPFTFEWEENFPYDGEYIFRGLCDNKTEFYLDNLKIANLGSFSDGVTPIRKTLKAGIHKIRLDLLNNPIYETKQEKVQTTLPINGWNGPGVYLDLRNIDKDVTVSFKTVVEESRVFHGVNIPDVGVLNESNTRRGKNIQLKGGRVYGPCTPTARANIYVGNENPNVRGSGTRPVTQLVLEEGGDDWNDYVVSTSIGQWSRIDEGFTVTDSFIDIQVISGKSWNENPMGVAFTIDAPPAPLPEIPQESIILQEGRCPNNPIWTTRFPSAKERWYPVILDSRWSRFMNRYAISPVQPLSENNSESSGVVWRNSWNLDIPYDGFYALKGTVDNAGRILIDGNEISKLNGFKDETPDSKKFFLSKGRHEIQVEVENFREEIFKIIDKKVFSSLDWVYVTKAPPTPPPQTADVNFTIDTSQTATYTHNFKIPELNIDVYKPSRTKINKTVTGKFELGKKYGVQFFVNGRPGGGLSIVNDGRTIILEDGGGGTPDMNVTANNGKFVPIQGQQNNCYFFLDAGPAPNLTPRLFSGAVVNDITYEGPELIQHNNRFWNKYLNSNGLSPLIPGGSPDESGRKKFIWNNVTFFESGQYDIKFIADNNADLYINGIKVLKAQEYSENIQTYSINVTKGTYSIVIDSEYPYTNGETNTSTYFADNPTGFALEITKKVSIGTGITKPWTANPIGISAVLIPPPCPRRVRGKGVVTNVIVDDPGNGYPGPAKDGYPAALRLKAVEVEDPGINYNCGVDQIQITPSNGAVLDYVCDSFGRIIKVIIVDPGLGFTTYPEITIVPPPGPTDTGPTGAGPTDTGPTDTGPTGPTGAGPTGPTGINATFRPQFEVVRDPIVTDTQKLIQVTDLVGLKQTGYVDGRAYYGSVFYKEGVRYAGFYETPGDLVQIYDTLKESIDAKVTTPASAILRQGTDVTSNDPRLNIPRTPENLI